MSEIAPILAPWANFYMLTGSAAAALTGLMFVVITLIFGETRLNPSAVEPLVGLIGLCGGAYICRLMNRQRRLTTYKPDLEDWTWFTAAPFVAYAAILAGAILLHVLPAKALFVIGGAIVLLIFIGIRNSWDVVTYMATGGPTTPAP